VSSQNYWPGNPVSTIKRWRIDPEEAVKFFRYRLVSDGVMQEFIAKSKETLKVLGRFRFTEVADFSFARRAISDLSKKVTMLLLD